MNRLRIQVGPELGAKVERFDAAVDSFFDRWRGQPVPDRVFYAASQLGDHSLIWLMLGALRGARSERHARAALRLGAGMGIESALVNLGIKSLFRRARPTLEVDRPFALRKPLTSSFPSGHSTSAFTAAGLLAEDDHLWPLYYAVAVVVAWSRVYVKVHHASDVVAGIALGVVMGHLGRRLSPLTRRPVGLVSPLAAESPGWGMG